MIEVDIDFTDAEPQESSIPLMDDEELQRQLGMMLYKNVQDKRGEMIRDVFVKKFGRMPSRAVMDRCSFVLTLRQPHANGDGGAYAVVWRGKRVLCVYTMPKTWVKDGRYFSKWWFKGLV